MENVTPPPFTCNVCAYLVEALKCVKRLCLCICLSGMCTSLRMVSVAAFSADVCGECGVGCGVEGVGVSRGGL